MWMSLYNSLPLQHYCCICFVLIQLLSLFRLTFGGNGHRLQHLQQQQHLQAINSGVNRAIGCSGGMTPSASGSNACGRLRISLNIKRFDGGSIMIYKNGEEQSIAPIEQVLYDNYRHRVKYLASSPSVEQQYGQQHQGKPPKMGSSSKSIWKGAYSGFVQFEEASVDHLQGTIVQIWDLLHQIALHDPKWVMPGDPVEAHHQFEPMFDGHAMVVLTSEGGVEKARFHLVPEGLVMFKKGEGSFMIDAKLDEAPHKQNPLYTAPVRGPPSFRVQFHPSLWTRPDIGSDIEQLKRAAFKAAGAGAPWTIDTNTCMHFVYKFVLDIAEQPPEAMRHHPEAWPEEFQMMDLHFASDMGFGRAFEIALGVQKKND